MRLNFPDDEAKFDWLPLLLDAYAVIDNGILLAINNGGHRKNLSLACKEGCDNCCRTHKDIPVYPIELVGIYWFTIEKITEPIRGILKKQLGDCSKDSPCPFLIKASCSIHPMRPIACRQFNVFAKKCEDGEDPYYTRRDDVLTPVQEYTDEAFYVTLPFYGITNETDKVHIIKNNLIHSQVHILRLLNWKELAARMKEFDPGTV